LERAARFIYLQRLAFGGQVKGTFGVSPGTAPRFSLARLEPILDAAHERLSGVVFECLDWSDLIDRYDTTDSLSILIRRISGARLITARGIVRLN